MKIRTNRNPVAQETMRVLGADIFVCETEDTRAHIIEGDCDGGETVYSRIYPLGQNTVSKSVLDTKHSLFLTTMIMRDDFWSTLSPEVQAVIKDAAIKAGRREREVTIQDGEDAKKQLVADGIDVIELSEEETAEWKSKAQAVYEKFEPTFSPGLIDKIKKA
jgi:TRAP-type C4-dicarboxylate transport system substrate-binding protein